MNTAVPGLAVTREDGRRESYTVKHVPSGPEIILDLPGPGSAQDAMHDLAGLLDWSMTRKRLLTILEAFPEVCTEVERVARKWGGTSHGGALVARFPERMSA